MVAVGVIIPFAWFDNSVDSLVREHFGISSGLFLSGSLFPFDGDGWNALGLENQSDGNHNFGFTTELRYWFEYTGDAQLYFSGDDDVWVFINGQLADQLPAGVNMGGSDIAFVGITSDTPFTEITFQGRDNILGFLSFNAIDNFEYGFAVIPEPSTLCLIALSGLFLLRLRRA